MSYKIFENNLVPIRKSKLALKLNKPAYIGMCILDLSEVLMFEFHYGYINSKKTWGGQSDPPVFFLKMCFVEIENLAFL